MRKDKKSLAETHPEIAQQWHSTKNGDLTPSDVTYGSDKKVWWKCPKGDDHEWISSVQKRTSGRKCPVCSNKKAVLSNCLATKYPEIAKNWHPTKNGDLTPYNVLPKSNKKVWWKCPEGDDHEFYSTISTLILQNVDCPVCAGREVRDSNCLAKTFPEIASEWHPTKNGDLTPYDVTSGSGKKVWWKCPEGDDHEWEIRIATRSYSKSNCPICSGRKAIISNSLVNTYPQLALQWHPTKNGDLMPYDFKPGSGKKVWWKCDKFDHHEWKTKITHRTYMKSNCPYCYLTPQSKQELTITFELMKFFNNIDPKGFKTRLDGRLRAIDILIPELNLCIEFDGAYWHKNRRDIDKIKSEMLFEEGFELIRVREEPLKKIYDTDVISKKPYNGKQVTNDILSVILNMFDLDQKLISRIKEYQSKDDLQNEKGLEKYIDKILTEKADKKSSKSKTAK